MNRKSCTNLIAFGSRRASIARGSIITCYTSHGDIINDFANVAPALGSDRTN